jgi:hypothetical protein
MKYLPNKDPEWVYVWLSRKCPLIQKLRRHPKNGWYGIWSIVTLVLCYLKTSLIFDIPKSDILIRSPLSTKQLELFRSRWYTGGTLEWR